MSSTKQNNTNEPSLLQSRLLSDARVKSGALISTEIRKLAKMDMEAIAQLFRVIKYYKTICKQ